ncbi:MAG: hydroxyacylglutathione hydrolase [Aestuariivirgaceae bacterium]
MSELDIHQFLCREDNFGVLLRDKGSAACAAIDAPEDGAIEKALRDTGWKLTHILVTHHHDDHVAAIPALKARHGAKVVANRADSRRIPGVDETVEPGQTYAFAGHKAAIIDTPGHTRGHIAWHFQPDGVVFVGDTLFSLGCGRVIEGTMAEMWGSLDRLRKLPAETKVYCGHEYTLANARFALTVDPDNPDLKTRAAEAAAEVKAGRLTLPVTIAAERRANPFLRPEDSVIRTRLGLAEAADADVFAEIRRRKNAF